MLCRLVIFVALFMFCFQLLWIKRLTLYTCTSILKGKSSLPYEGVLFQCFHWKTLEEESGNVNLTSNISWSKLKFVFFEVIFDRLLFLKRGTGADKQRRLERVLCKQEMEQLEIWKQCSGFPVVMLTSEIPVFGLHFEFPHFHGC